MNKGFFGAILCTIIMSAVNLSGYVPKPESAERQNFQLLFIQTAEEAVLRQNPKNPDQWTLTLKNVDPEIAYFSESPKKMAGKVSISNFLQEWDTKTSKRTPQGALVTKFSHSSAQGSDQERQIYLSNPRWSSKNNTLTYDVLNPFGSKSLTQGNHQAPVLFIEKY